MSALWVQSDPSLERMWKYVNKSPSLRVLGHMVARRPNAKHMGMVMAPRRQPTILQQISPGLVVQYTVLQTVKSVKVHPEQGR